MERDETELGRAVEWRLGLNCRGGIMTSYYRRIKDIIPNISQEKIHRRLMLVLKNMKFRLCQLSTNSVPVFVLGYGRSGTSMLIQIFQRDSRIDACGESDSRVMKDWLLDRNKALQTIYQSKSEVVIMKPILNSFEATNLLMLKKGCKIIWMIREYRDVVASAIRKFGTTVSNQMKDAVKNANADNWLSRGIPEDTFKILRELDDNRFTEYDWQSLVWWSINRTILLDKLFEKDKQFILVRYEYLVQKPQLVLSRLYDFIGLPYRPQASKYISSSSVGKGNWVQLNSKITNMCDELWSQCCSIARNPT